VPPSGFYAVFSTTPMTFAGLATTTPSTCVPPLALLVQMSTDIQGILKNGAKIVNVTVKTKNIGYFYLLLFSFGLCCCF